MNNTQLSQLSKLVQSNPVMLAKIEKLHAGIRIDLRKKNAPKRPVMQAITHDEVAKLSKTTPTTLRRFLDFHSINGDVLVGSRMAFSKPLAGMISEAVFYSQLALLCSNAHAMLKDSSPEDAEQGRALAVENRAKCQEIVASITRK
ncbi:MAG: hypothetical protein K8R57_08665 [Verrucomicrobia bacterium]|nr:hypothetical protein [Verrucomicrobiota bacterium]